MRKLATAFSTLGMVLSALPAFAVDTSKVYSSNLLVYVFLGFCALFLVSQLIPAVMMVIGIFKGMAQKAFKGKLAAQEQGDKDAH